MRPGALHKVREQSRKERNISSIPFICSRCEMYRNRLLRKPHKNVLKFDFVLVLSDITYHIALARSRVYAYCPPSCYVA